MRANGLPEAKTWITFSRLCVATLLVFCTCCVVVPTAAQSLRLSKIEGKSLLALRYEQKQVELLPVRWFSGGSFNPYMFLGLTTSTGNWERASEIARMHTFSPNDLALFCRLEFYLEKSVRFPIKIRLGEVQYVEQLEGKYK